MQFRKKERKKERKTEKNYFRVLNNFLGFRDASFFSLFLSFFLSFSSFRFPRFLERVLAQLTEKDREAHKAQKQRFERERERTLRERSFCPSFFFFLQKSELYSIYKEYIHITEMSACYHQSAASMARQSSFASSSSCRRDEHRSASLKISKATPRRRRRQKGDNNANTVVTDERVSSRPGRSKSSKKPKT